MQACSACGASNVADARFCSACGVPLASDPGTLTRKTVTILYSDLAGFTALGERLDPEPLHEVMARYFTAMRAAIDRHGGRVEKYIGDAIMAVFGVPRLHEDDALRAARCALEMRAALTALNRELESVWGVTLHARYGLSTGEVAFARVGAHPFFALGDAVNVAQRLESAAPADEVLINRQTARLLGGIARLQRLDPLTLKGKSEPVPAWRLRGAAAGRRGGRQRAARRAWWDATGSWTPCARRWPTCRPSGAAVWSPFSDPRASASPAWCAASSPTPRRRPPPPSVAASPTARASPSGRWPRSSSSSPDGPTSPRSPPSSATTRRRDGPPRGLRSRSGSHPAPRRSRRSSWRCAASWRRRRAGVRSSWSSRTSTGPSPPSSTFSSTSPHTPTTCRCSWCAWRAPSC